jgi:uncharacterized RDD family membrane protein YckC
VSDDPFGRRGEERTDPFGRPLPPEGEEEAPAAPSAGSDPPPREGDAERTSLWLPPAEARDERAGEGSGGAAADAPHGFAPPTDAPHGFAPPTDAPHGFAPPTDAPPDAQAWWAGATPGTIEGRAHGARVPAGEPAEWVARAGAALLDLLVRFAIVFVATLLGAIAYAGGDAAGDAGTTVGFVIGALAAYAYAPWMIATRNGQTLGHRATSTRIVRTNGAPLSGGGAFVREVLAKGLLFDAILIWLTLGILPLLNYLWPLWDDRNEALHDKMCGTAVVKA